MTPELMSFAIAGLAFISIAGVGFVFFGAEPDVASKRARQIATQQLAAAKGNDPIAQRRKHTQEMLKNLREAETERKKSIVPQDMGTRLEQAGLTINVATFWMVSMIVGGGLAAAMFFLAPASIELTPLGASARPVLAGAAGFAGFLGLPRWVLGMMTKARHKKFTNQFADAIDIIVRGVKSGLPLIECLRIIARESPEPLRSEFAQVADGLSMGQTVEQCLQKMYIRVPLQEVNFFQIVLSIQAKAGGNLSEALGNLALVIRTRKMLREKISALSSEAKASAMIIGVLPIGVMVLVYITTPEYIMELFLKPVGNMILLIGAGLMGSGIYVMRRMINFDF